MAAEADRLGFSELWVGEMATFDVFALATAIAARTKQIGLVLGPLAVSVRTPMTMAMGIASVAALADRSVDLALGASSHVVVEEWHGRARARTATHMQESAQVARALLAGEKVRFEGELASCKGYHLRLPASHSSVTIAAFSPAAIRAAARQGDRMLLNMVSPEAVAMLRQQLEDAARAAGRETPPLAIWLPAALDPSEASQQQMLSAIVGYLAAPGYGEMFAAAGFAELVEYARTRPHPRELLAAMPMELLSAAGLVGSADTLRDGLSAYARAGADEICLVPATAGDPAGARTLAAMAQWRQDFPCQG